MITNYYQRLQLSTKASMAEVAEQYRKLALRYHPKYTQEAPAVAAEMFSSVAEAYEVLSDPVKRAYYDKYGYETLKEEFHS
jgi:curved DNA-binding protein CbpA